MDYIIRLPARTVSENGTGGGYRADPTAYSKAQMELIWAIVAQEDNGSYAGALAVISSAMNRTESVRWKSWKHGPGLQLTAPGQYYTAMIRTGGAGLVVMCCTSNRLYGTV